MRIFDIEIRDVIDNKLRQIEKAVPEWRLPWDVLPALEKALKMAPNAYIVIRPTPESTETS